jgi:PIN domain nuclease of toxin-antitoxin system
MNLLLDTQIFLWWYREPNRISARIWNALRDPTNQLALSVVSMWEIQIKVSIGKLQLPTTVENLVSTYNAINQVRSLPVFEYHIWPLVRLPRHHRDPFDRLLIAQAIAEDYTLVTADSLFAQYPVHILS